MRNEREWALSKKFSAFLDERVYPERWSGWTCERITDKQRQATYGDVSFSKNGLIAFVDEKAYATIWDGCLIELLQDIGTQELGWFYTLKHCTHLICGYYRSAGDGQPATVYKISWPKLRSEYVRLCHEELHEDRPGHYVTAKGYGLTLFAKVKWWQVKEHIELLWGVPAFVTDEESKQAWQSTDRNPRKAGAA